MGFGDDLMLAGEARRLRESYGPNAPKIAALRRPGQYRWSPVWDHNPDFARLHSLHDPPAELTLTLDPDSGRRYRASETRQRRVWTQIGPVGAEIELTEGEKGWAAKNIRGYDIVIEPNVKALAPPNKDWGFERWQKLVDLAPEMPWVQLGAGATGGRPLRGVRQVECPSFRHAAAALGFALALVTPEGGLHHAAAAVRLRRVVVIYGGYISPVQTGYPGQVGIFTGGEPCGWRTPCQHCAAAMAAIAPERVLAELQGLLAHNESMAAQ